MQETCETYQKNPIEEEYQIYAQRPKIERINPEITDNSVISKMTYVFHFGWNIYTSENRLENSVILHRKTIYTFFPANYNEQLLTEIEKSKYILNLKDDWDEEGSKGYGSKIWEKAILFLCNLYEDFLIYKNPSLIPKIFHGPDQSIDLLWENKEMHLLINIPANSDRASFHCGNPKGIFNGEFYISTPNPAIFSFLF